VANFTGAGVFSTNSTQEAQLEAFMMEFDSNLAPIVGQQTTVTAGSGQDILDRVDLLIERADATYFTSPTLGAVPECDLIVKGAVNGKQRGWFYIGGNTFESDTTVEGNWTKSQLLTEAAQAGQHLTFTCVPPGSGRRMGIDRDADNTLDGQDSLTCSASGALGASQRGSLVALMFLMIAGLAARRLRRRT
jgi:hypothetical protein